jgi:hypothetical protein
MRSKSSPRTRQWRQHEPDADLHALGIRLLAEFQHALAAGAIHADGLFHEHVDAFFDGVLKLYPAEGGRRGEHDDIALFQHVDRLLVGVEADELGVRGDGKAVRVLGAEAVEAGFQTVFLDIRHGYEAGALLDAHGVAGGAGAAATAAHEGHADGVIPGGVNVGDRDAGEGGDARNGLGGGLQEVAAGGGGDGFHKRGLQVWRKRTGEGKENLPIAPQVILPGANAGVCILKIVSAHPCWPWGSPMWVMRVMWAVESQSKYPASSITTIMVPAGFSIARSPCGTGCTA